MKKIISFLIPMLFVFNYCFSQQKASGKNQMQKMEMASSKMQLHSNYSEINLR